MDHAKEAERLLSPLPNVAKSERLAEAQVHATLALAEQQRIANLIALATLADAKFGAYAGGAGLWGTLFDNPETEYGNVHLKPGIARALGLDSEGDE